MQRLILHPLFSKIFLCALIGMYVLYIAWLWEFSVLYVVGIF